MKQTNTKPVRWAMVTLAVAWLSGCVATPSRSVGENPIAPRVEGYAWRTFVGQPGGLGNVDGRGAGARFCQPYGVAYDVSDNLYVADYYNYTVRKIAPDGTVSTLAGCVGEPGDNDGTGNSARFLRPTDVAVDAAGTVYVADSVGHVIRKVTADGAVTTLAGRSGEAGSADGSGREARFRSPLGVAVDGAGNVIVADAGNHTVRRISPAGAVTTLAGKAELKNGTPLGGFADGKGGTARFSAPRDVAADRAGNVFVADTDNAVVRKIAADGTVSTLAGSVGQPGYTNAVGQAARFNSPQSVAVDPSGNVLILDAGNKVVRRVTPAGAVTTLTNSVGRFVSPRGLSVDRNGNVAVSDNDAQTVNVLMTSGTVTVLAGATSRHGYADGKGEVVRFNRPTGIAVDRQKNLYVADMFTSVIRKVTPDGEVTTLAGKPWTSGVDNGKGGAARLNWPGGLAIDRAGNLIVADTGNHAIRMVAPDGTVATLAGTAGSSGSADGTGAVARFNAPAGVAVDGAGNVLVADAGNHVIRKISPSGAVTTLAGTAGKAGRSDGAGAAARFFSPGGVAVDTLGNVYVADTSNHVIRKVIPGGEVTTLAGCPGMKGSADGSGGDARFNGPCSVAMDLTGNLIVTDRDNHLIRMVTPEGRVTTIGGAANRMSGADGFGTASRFAQPAAVAVDNDGIIYLADSCNNRIVTGVWGAERAPNVLGGADVACDALVPCVPYSWEVFVGQAGVPGSEDGRGCGARLRAPQGLAIGDDDALFVADGSDNTVRRIAPDGTVTTLKVARELLSAPVGVAVSRLTDGVLVTDSAHVLWRVGVDGQTVRLAGGANQSGATDGVGGAARFDFIPGVVADRAGNVYLADHNNHTVRRMTPDGRVTTLAGRAGEQGCFDGAGDAARFMLPIALVVDRAGNVVVADGNKLRRMTPSGAVETLRPAGPRFGRLDGLASDRTGNLYAADRENHVIWQISPQGEVRRLGSSALAMGGAGWLVTGLAVDSRGNVYVSDAVRNCIIRGRPLRR